MHCLALVPLADLRLLIQVALTCLPAIPWSSPLIDSVNNPIAIARHCMPGESQPTSASAGLQTRVAG